MKISTINNANTYTGTGKQNDINKPYTSNVSFHSSRKLSNAEKAGAGLGIAGLAVSIFKRKSISKGLKTLGKKLDKLINPNKVRQMDVSGAENIDADKNFKKRFLNDIVEIVRNPFTKNIAPNEPKKLQYISNGVMLNGPDSKAKEDTFNWMLNKMKEAGAEIIDPGKGKKAKFDDVSNEWWKMWDSNNDENFKKTGKYRVFVVRGLDEIGQPSTYKEPVPFPEGLILKDSPDSNQSAMRHGILLFYTCKDASKVDPAVIRKGRIDMINTPQPYADEPLSIWKDYLEDAKCSYPQTAVSKLYSAKRVLSAKGEDVMAEMKPYFDYSVPYITPKSSAPLKTWQEYINKESKNVDRSKCNTYLAESLKYVQGDLSQDEKGREKLKAIIKMTEDIQKPEHLKQWRKHLRFTLGGDDIAYGSYRDETNSEYIQRMLRKQGIENPFVNETVNDIKDIKKD